VCLEFSSGDLLSIGARWWCAPSFVGTVPFAAAFIIPNEYTNNRSFYLSTRPVYFVIVFFAQMDTTDIPCLPMSSPVTATPFPTGLTTAKKVHGTDRARSLIKGTLAAPHDLMSMAPHSAASLVRPSVRGTILRRPTGLKPSSPCSARN